MYIVLASICVICLPVVAMAFFYVRIGIVVRSSRRRCRLTARRRSARTNLNLVSESKIHILLNPGRASKSY